MQLFFNHSSEDAPDAKVADADVMAIEPSDEDMALQNEDMLEPPGQGMAGAIVKTGMTWIGWPSLNTPKIGKMRIQITNTKNRIRVAEK